MQLEFYQPGDPVGDILFNWLPLLIALVFVCVGAVALKRGFRHYVNSVLLKRHGQPGVARVTNKWIKRRTADRRNRNRGQQLKYHFLQFQLMEDPRAFSVKEIAPIALWDGVEPGDTVDVIYHPNLSIMRLAAWKSYIGLGAGFAQMVIGIFVTSIAAGVIVSGMYDALRAPEIQAAAQDWQRDKAEVLAMGTPANPYLRLFAPGSKMIRVVFGETNGGALMANLRVLRVTADQIEAYGITRGAVLPARIDPANEYNAVLELELQDRF